MKIAFITKKNKPNVNKAINFLNKFTKKDLDIYFANQNQKIPAKLYKKKYDLIISYICPWILDKKILSNTKKYNINFHPGPPEYPGIGCFNFALYYSAKSFGTTSHIMLNKVDSGRIIYVNRFKMNSKTQLSEIMNKTYDLLYLNFKKVIKDIFTDKTLNFSDETWTRKPYTRNQLNKLNMLNLNMTKKEILKRIQAMHNYEHPGPFIQIKGIKFAYHESEIIKKK